jgi:hypothetical protein
VTVGASQPVGVALGEEAGVKVAVVADRDGPSAEVDDLDQVGVAGVLTVVVVVASVDRVHGAGGHWVNRLLLCRVEHRPHPFAGRRCTH